jgi:haloalkane dehalogenase
MSDGSNAMSEATTKFFLEAPMQWTETRGAKIAYRQFGRGPALVFVHGFPLTGATWRKILPELSQRFTCYVLDLPGMGETMWGDSVDFSFRGQAATIKAFVDRLGLTDYSVIAQDTGGTFARLLALSDPRVKKLVILNTEVPNHRPPWIPLYQTLLGLPGTLASFNLLMRSRMFLRSPMGLGGCFSDPSLIDGDFRELFVAPLLASKTRLEGMGKYLRGLRHWEAMDALAQEHARITIPVLLIWGADDPTFPIAHARRMVQQFGNAKLVEVPGARLLVHEEKPEAVVKAILSF